MEEKKLRARKTKNTSCQHNHIELKLALAVLKQSQAGEITNSSCMAEHSLDQTRIVAL